MDLILKQQLVYLMTRTVLNGDEIHSEYEDRYITIGLIDGIACVIMAVYTDREEAIRIISARKSTKQEREMYYDYS